MNLLFCGDVVGRAGREAVVGNVPELRKRLKLDFVVIIGENAAHGFGITDKLCREFYAAGVDCITTGNHAWDQREIIGYIDSDPKLLRPANYPRGTGGEAPPPTAFPPIKVPVLVIHGMKDTALNAAGHNGTWDHVDADTTLLMIPNAGHFVQHDAEAMVDRTIHDWLEARR